MAQLLVRNLDDDVKERLQRRAALHGRSMEEEVRTILRAAADQDVETQPSEGLGTHIARRFAGLGMDFDIPEWRGETIRPVDFGPDDEDAAGNAAGNDK